MKRSLLAATFLILAFGLSSCSDSESSNPNGIAEGESSSSTAASDLQSSASVPADTIPLDSSGFADIQDVYKGIKSNEKAVFIVRHAEREPRITKETKLTEDGVEQAISVGKKLVGSEDFNYISTEFVRTKETCQNIALGRGQTTFPYDSTDAYTSSTYIKDDAQYKEYTKSEGNVRLVIAKWAYDGEFADAFFDLKETSESMITKTLQAVQGRVAVVCSHDDFLVPMIAYLTDKKADVKFYETNNWLNYLAGVAIIVDDKGNRRTYAIKGLQKGTM